MLHRYVSVWVHCQGQQESAAVSVIGSAAKPLFVESSPNTRKNDRKLSHSGEGSCEWVQFTLCIQVFKLITWMPVVTLLTYVADVHADCTSSV